MRRICFLAGCIFLGFIPARSQSRSPAATQLFIAVNGNDNNPGTIEKPFATLQKARNVVRKLSPEKNGVTVFLRGGIYQVKETCVFSGLDSGTRTAPVTYRNYGSEKVVFHGGTKLDNRLFKPVKDPVILDRLPVESRSNVVFVNLKEAGVTTFGKLAQHGFAIPVTPAPLELFFDGNPLLRARWPNVGTVKIGEVFDAGSNFRMGDTTRRGAEFRFSETRANRWKDPANAWISGLFSNSWSDDNLQIERLDTLKHLMKLAQPHLYSVQSSSTDKDHLRGFFIYNLLEEIDQPGEWYLDEKNGLLYVWPPAPVQGRNIEVSQLSIPFVKLENTANVHIAGITFECARGMGILIRDSKNCSVIQSIFRNLGTVAISMGDELQGGKLSSNPDGSPKREDTRFHKNSNILVDHCTIYNVGTGGIILAGGDRRNLVAGNNVVQNCEIYSFSRINTTYSPAVNIQGVGNVVRNCYIHDGPHEALSFLGNNHLIEYNHFQRLCTAAHDMGAVYTGRDPSSRGTRIRFNYFDDIRTSIAGSVCAIYLDDGSGGIHVEGNIFYRSSSLGRYNYGAIFIHGGNGSFFLNNLFIDCELAFGNTPWGDQKWKEFVSSPLLKKRMLEDVNIYSAVYRKNYPELKGFMDTSVVRPRINRSVNSVVIGTGKFTNGRNYLHTDSLISRRNPGFIDPDRNDFRIQPASEIANKLPGFKLPDFKQIGIQTHTK